MSFLSSSWEKVVSMAGSPVDLIEDRSTCQHEIRYLDSRIGETQKGCGRGSSLVWRLVTGEFVGVFLLEVGKH
jgi:hypothetical protein